MCPPVPVVLPVVAVVLNPPMTANTVEELTASTVSRSTYGAVPVEVENVSPKMSVVVLAALKLVVLGGSISVKAPSVVPIGWLPASSWTTELATDV